MPPDPSQQLRGPTPRFGGAWAKVEIFLGLASVGVGLFVGVWGVSRTDVEWAFASVGLVLFVLGGYLTLAGQRSHLYRSNMETAEVLKGELHREKEPVQAGETK